MIKKSSSSVIFPMLILLSNILIAGVIKGTVYDRETGEPLVGANVIILNSRSGSATDQSGQYKPKSFLPPLVLPFLLPWKYDVKVLMIGYKAFTVKNVPMGILQSTRLDIPMERTNIPRDEQQPAYYTSYKQYLVYLELLTWFIGGYYLSNG